MGRNGHLAGEAIAKALDHLVDVGLIVVPGIVLLWASAATIVVLRDRWRVRPVWRTGVSGRPQCSVPEGALTRRAR
jgi:hypothetical protein